MPSCGGEPRSADTRTPSQCLSVVLQVVDDVVHELLGNVNRGLVGIITTGSSATRTQFDPVDHTSWN